MWIVVLLNLSAVDGVFVLAFFQRNNVGGVGCGWRTNAAGHCCCDVAATFIAKGNKTYDAISAEKISQCYVLLFKFLFYMYASYLRGSKYIYLHLWLSISRHHSISFAWFIVWLWYDCVMVVPKSYHNHFTQISISESYRQ